MHKVTKINENLQIDDTIKTIEGMVQCVINSLGHIKININDSPYAKLLAYAMINIEDTVGVLNRINEELKVELLKELTRD
jgi:uncharacterized membrane protein